MRILIALILLASCSVSKTASKDKKDSTSVIKSNQTISVDSIYQSTKKEIEIADLVVVFKDSATGFFHWSGDSISIPASAIKEVRQKKSKSTQKHDTGSLKKEVVSRNETKTKVSSKLKNSTKEKQYPMLWWIIPTILAVLLYMSRKYIREFF